MSLQMQPYIRRPSPKLPDQGVYIDGELSRIEQSLRTVIESVLELQTRLATAGIP